MKNICLQMNRKAWLTMLLLICLSFPALAQKITVQGTVVDATGEPLIGASVIPQGTTLGTATDFDGKFRIEVDPNATLVVSYVGYTPKKVSVDGRTQIRVTLEDSTVKLDEVVAIGYGVVKKSDATGAVSMIKPSEVEAGLATSAQDLLVGQSPGVVVTTSGGSPDGAATIRIRGGASIAASNDPLIVIDGVPMDNTGIKGLGNQLSMISPENVESMTVLKDASATAIYGSRASNGVIIITTKKGKSGKPQVNFSANMYINTPRNYVNMMGADEFREYVKKHADQLPDPTNVLAALGDSNTDWQKEILRTSVSSDYSLSVGGQMGFLPYRVSGTFTNSNGIVKTTQMNRATLGINLSPKFFGDLLTVNVNLKGAYVSQRFTEMGALGGAVGFNPTLPVFDPNGNKFNNYTTYVGGEGNINTLAALNPVSQIQEYDSRSKVWQSIGNLQLDLAMPFLRDLHANLNLGYDVSKSDVNNYQNQGAPITWKDYQFSDPGQGFNKIEHQTKYNELLDFYLNYKKEFSRIKSSLDVTAGYSWQKFHNEGYDRTVNTTGEHAGELRNGSYSAYANPNVLVSFFGRINYGFMDRYLLTVTVRRDGSSRFGPDNRWGTFPSVALAWRLIDEPWMKGAENVLNDLKIRAGYGVTGQQDLGDDYFPYLPVYLIGKDPYRYPSIIGGDGYTTLIKANGYMSNLKWEETDTWNVGVDFAFLNNRINGSIDYYKRNTKDLLCKNVPLPAGSNLTNALSANIGNMENYGVEFSISTRPVVTKDFTWSSDLNVAWNKNKITKLYGGEDGKPFYVPNSTDGRISSGTGTDVLYYAVGEAANSFLVFQQVYDNDGNPIPNEFVDRNSDGKIDESDRYFYHSRDPKVVATWNNSFKYKSWDFGIVLRANFGNYIYNDVMANNTNGTAIESAPISNLMRDTFIFYQTSVNQLTSDYFVQNASFLRCDNITLGYTWSKLLSGQLRLRLFGAVQNPFVITKYKGLDPEVFSGNDKNVYPRPITFTIGVVATF